MSNMKRAMEEFNFWFDDQYGDIEIAGMKFSASDILYQMDEIAYYEEYHSYLDMMEVV